MQFLSPSGWWALLALAIPLALHLLSRKPGALVKVGSVQFLSASASARFKSLKLSDVLLLLLRMALIALLALLLARPVWLGQASALPLDAQGWVLVAPELLAASHRYLVQPVLDSLAAVGQQPRLFSAGFPPLQPNDSPPIVVEEQNHWSLLRELEQALPGTAPVQIFSGQSLRNFRGERPVLKRGFAWKSYSTAQHWRWLNSAQRFQRDSLHLVTGYSTGARTQYSGYSVSMPAQRAILSGKDLPAVEYIPTPRRGQAQLQLIQQEGISSGDSLSVQLETDSLRIALVYIQPEFTAARYLQAALQTAASATFRNLRVARHTPENVAWSWGDFDLLFWLAEDSLPAPVWEQVERGLVLVTAAPRKSFEVHESWIVMPHCGTPFLPPRLWRRSPPANIGVPVWSDGFGAPLLEAERRGQGWHYRFASRFDAEWNELVWHTAFPEWLLDLLSRPDILPKRSLAPFDQRRLSATQILPRQEANQCSAVATGAPVRGLHFPLWLLALMIFGLERWISHRNRI